LPVPDQVIGEDLMRVQAFSPFYSHYAVAVPFAFASQPAVVEEEE